MSELKKLTRLGANTKKIAALLQAKAPKGHMLAYINPQEAALLKSRGGKGTPHEDTGIPSFELDDSFAMQGGADPVTGAQATPEAYGGDFYGSAVMPDFSGGFAAPQIDYGGGLQDFSTQAPTFASQTGEATPTVTMPPRTPEEFPEELEQYKRPFMSRDTMARLGLAGALGLIGSRQASRAGAAGQAGAMQMRQLAAPYQQKGVELQAAAQRGELTPSAQQSLQALQAQAAQGAERRGGVGAAQVMQQVEAFRQQLLQQQYDYGLKLSSIGDNIALGAIKTGLQADQAVNQLTNSFYTNMAYIAAGVTPGMFGGR